MTVVIVWTPILTHNFYHFFVILSSLKQKYLWSYNFQINLKIKFSENRIFRKSIDQFHASRVPTQGMRPGKW